ncbi:MAG TPA: sugar phosphate isomerase/epimerase family protein [Terriglobia bacterium]|nr:sugar phosphate isomerase/epimerase family protein [Terriglobia bacterium]
MQRRSFLKTAGVLSAAACLSDFAESSLSGKPAASPLTRFKLGVISDEFSQDLEEALKTMKGFGLEWVELRTVWGIYNTEATPQQLQRIKDLLAQYRFKVSVVDTALYKCNLPGTQNVVGEKDAYPYAQQMDLLKRGSDRAHALGTDKVRVFSFWRTAHPGRSTSRIAEELSKASEAGRKQGVRLVLENEGSCNVATGHELAQMLKLVPAANFGVNWDVGNGYWHGEVSYPDGYAALDKSRIWHMHLKDVRCGAAASSEQKAEAFRKPGERVTEESKCHTAIVGTGQVDLKGQLGAVLKNNYQGTMSLEPEYEAPGVTHFEATRRSLEALLKIMSSAMA